MKYKHSIIIRSLLVFSVVAILSACGSTSTPAPNKAEITNIGEQDARIILDNNNTIEGVAEGQVRYSGSLDSDEREQARRIAKEGLVRKFVAQKMPNLINNYNKNKDSINENLRDLLLSEQVVSEEVNEDSKLYIVQIRAQINEPALMQMLNESAKGPRSAIVFVFMAREDRGQGSEDMSSAQKSDIIWTVDANSKDIDVAMGSVFADHNFVTQNAGILQIETDGQFSVDAFQNDYERGNDVSNNTMGRALIALTKVNPKIDYLGVGAMDIGRSEVDPVSGNIKVAVAVTGQVLNVALRGSRDASIGPVQYYGEGSTYTIAKNNALKSAAIAAAKVLAGQLRAKNVL